ncbi:hypothetical protein [Actinoplanes sp. DH11]|nr:hypothetical protein [Actinoplanes sp. DH11]
MSARKLGRLAGLVLVLAAVFGGVATGAGQASADEVASVRMSTLDFSWS